MRASNAPVVAAHRARTNSITNRRTTMGGFLNPGGTAIRSSEHATALIGLLQLAGGHPDGIVGSLGYGNRNQWLTTNTAVVFQDGGPLEAFTPVTQSVLQRHIRTAEQLAQSIFTRDHSNDTTGTAHEDIPLWVREFFRLFEAQRNVQNASAAGGRSLL